MQELISQYLQQAQEALPKYIIASIVLITSFIGASLVSRLIKNRLEKKAEDVILVQLIRRISYWTFVLIGLLIAMKVVGLTDVAASLLAGAGVSAFIIGFAFKDIAENFLAGIILAFNRPFNIGDTIETAQIKGKVVELDLRNAHIKTFDGKDVFVPNALILKEPLVNSSKDNTLRHEFVLLIDYSEDIDKVSNLIIERIKKVDGVYTDKNPFVSVDEFSSLGVRLKVHFWVKLRGAEISPIKLRRIVQSQVKNELIANNISIPKSILEDRSNA